MLLQLHREIDSRTREIASSHQPWPCRRGCDTCCRRLAGLPRLTRVEWNLLEQGLATLPHPLQLSIGERIRALDPSTGPHHVCPFLDREEGSCLVYQSRPIACRTYGFYVERDRGLYCALIEDRVATSQFADVVWGNVASIEARLDASSDRIGILDWFNHSPLSATPSTSPDPCSATR